MNRRIVGITLAAASVFAAQSFAENNTGGGLSTSLSGFNEVPLAILSPGNGTLDVRINEGSGTVDYTLSYSGLTNPVTQAHIHFGQEHVTGGVIAFLCSNLGNAPAGVPACPQFEGTVSGTINASGVVGQEDQNFPAGDLSALVTVLRSGAAYGNVHTDRFPAGELRGQIPGQASGNGG